MERIKEVIDFFENYTPEFESIRLNDNTMIEDVEKFISIQLLRVKTLSKNNVEFWEALMRLEALKNITKQWKKN